MVATSIAILIIWFLLYIIIRTFDVRLAISYVFITFLFAYVVSNREFSAFYLLAYLVAVVVDLMINEVNTTTSTSNKIGSIKGFGFIALELIAGLIVYVLILGLGRQAGGNIVGVPNLAVATSPSAIAGALLPTFQSALGIVENTIFFVVYDILFKFAQPLLIALFTAIPFVGGVLSYSVIIMPYLIVGFIFAMFHVLAYSVALALLLYAMGAFILFIISRQIFKDQLPADTGHYINNGVISVSRSLSIVT